MIKLFWYSRPHLNRGNVSNFGDELSRWIVEKVSGENVKWVNPKKQNIIRKNFTTHVLGIGSILHFGSKNSLIWGSGLIKKNSNAPNTKYYAVRGKFTRQELLRRGYKVPSIYGDPALLTSKFFTPQVSNPLKKIGIIPHYVEFDEINNWYKENKFSDEFLMIDLRQDISNVLKNIEKCSSLISSSLHGVIVPHAFGIPTLRVEFTNKIIGDGIKYLDYFDSVGINDYKPTLFTKKSFDEDTIIKLFKKFRNHTLPQVDISNIQDNLLKERPF